MQKTWQLTRATGQLRCHEVFHIHFNGKENLYAQNILNCMVKAEERKHQSIAFPAVSTGLTGYPLVKAATGTVEALLYKSLLQQNPGM